MPPKAIWYIVYHVLENCHEQQGAREGFPARESHDQIFALKRPVWWEGSELSRESGQRTEELISCLFLQTWYRCPSQESKDFFFMPVSLKLNWASFSRNTMTRKWELWKWPFGTKNHLIMNGRPNSHPVFLWEVSLESGLLKIFGCRSEQKPLLSFNSWTQAERELTDWGGPRSLAEGCVLSIPSLLTGWKPGSPTAPGPWLALGIPRSWFAAKTEEWWSCVQAQMPGHLTEVSLLWWWLLCQLGEVMVPSCLVKTCIDVAVELIF